MKILIPIMLIYASFVGYYLVNSRPDFNKEFNSGVLQGCLKGLTYANLDSFKEFDRKVNSCYKKTKK